MSLQIKITFPLKKKPYQNEPSLAVWEAGSARGTKHSVDLRCGKEQGNFMESYVFYTSFGCKRDLHPNNKTLQIFTAIWNGARF